MNKEINNQQGQTPTNTGFPVPPSDSIQAGAPAVPQSANGKWEAVDPASLGFTISGDMNRPILGPDGAYYCISNSTPEYSSIGANQHTAVPTPASIVQLPPIVQPIALVPFASQNQPLLQYDPNYRPAEPQTPQAPKYRLKPYKGISFVQILLSVAVIALLVVLQVISGKNIAGNSYNWAAYSASGLDVIYGILSVFGISVGASAYYDKIIGGHFANGLGDAFSADMLLSLMYLLVPVFVAIIIIVSLIMIIVYLVKMGKMKSPRGFSVGALINLCLSGGVIAMIFAIAKRENMSIAPGLTMYLTAGISLFMIIFSYFAKKNAYVLDETALKKVYILNDNN